MSKLEKSSREELIQLEKKLKELTDQNSKYLKDKKNLEMTNEFVSQEIETKKVQIVKYMKSLSHNNDPKSEKEMAVGNKKANLFVMEEQITKLFNSIQKNSNAHLQDKFKAHTEYLYNLQKEMKVSYLIIKKLDIKEEFLRSNKLAESVNLFENLRNLSKIGRLTYFNLKSCGPILMFRINVTSTFEEIRRKCCDVWSLSTSAYCLYDDSFNNLECCNDSKVNEFFSSYMPHDPTLGHGQVVFYLMEKLKLQRELLESQEKSIDSKSDVSEDDSNKTNNLGGGNDLENCLELIKSGKILKGIENFKLQKVDINKRFIDTAKMVDNNIFFILVNILFLIVSFYAITTKKNIHNWSYVNWMNTKFLNSNPPTEINTMYDSLNYFLIYADMSNPMNKVLQNTDFIFYGPIRFRFFKSNNLNCFSNYVGSSIFDNLIDTSLINCYSSDHDSTTWNTSSILGYPFLYPNQTNITHLVNSPIGNLDASGIVIDLNYRNSTDLKKKVSDLYFIANKTNGLLTDQVQALEVLFCFYDPYLDVFVTNLLIFQRDINQYPTITVANSIPFVTNMYETTLGSSTKNADMLRCVLLFILLTTIPIRIYQKYSNSETQGITIFIKLVFVVFFQMKNILLIASTFFMLLAFYNFISSYVPTIQYFTGDYFIDIYDFANSQKSARALDHLSMYLISIYTLKYLQFLESVQILFISFKKAAFEYFALFATICMLFIGLSILTNFVFGSYIYEYKNFLDSITMNIKIFIFIENSSVTEQFLTYYRVFSIIVLIIFIFLIRIFLINLFYPIFIEYYRIEFDKYTISKLLSKNEGEDELSFGEKLRIFICPCRTDRRKKKVDGLMKEMKDIKNDVL